MNIKLLISLPNGSRIQKEIVASGSQTIGQIKDTHLSEHLSRRCVVRFVIQGRVLDESRTVQSYDHILREGTAILVHITQSAAVDSNGQTNRRGAANTRNAAAFESEADQGLGAAVLYFGVAVILAYAWGWRQFHPDHFDSLSSFFLSLFSFLWVIAVVSIVSSSASGIVRKVVNCGCQNFRRIYFSCRSPSQ